MIEAGELIVKSYLKRIEKCEIVETNWNFFGNKDDIKNNEDVKKIGEKYNENKGSISIFNEGKGTIKDFDSLLDKSLLNQIEIDVVGHSNEGGYILAEVAMHTNGLNYGSNGDTLMKIERKLLKLVVLMLGYFQISKNKKGKIIFFAIKSLFEVKKETLDEFVKELNNNIKELGYKFKVSLIMGENFQKEYIRLKDYIGEKSSNDFERIITIDKIIKS